jgi:hypothetical protein
MRVAGVCGVVTEVAVSIHAVLSPRFVPSKSGDCILLTSEFSILTQIIYAACCSKHHLRVKGARRIFLQGMQGQRSGGLTLLFLSCPFPSFPSFPFFLYLLFFPPSLLTLPYPPHFSVLPSPLLSSVPLPHCPPPSTV